MKCPSGEPLCLTWSFMAETRSILTTVESTELSQCRQFRRWERCKTRLLVYRYLQESQCCCARIRNILNHFCNKKRTGVNLHYLIVDLSWVRSIFDCLWFQKVYWKFWPLLQSQWEVCINAFISVVLKSGRNRPLGGDFERQGGDRGSKQHKGGENAQPLIDHWDNFSSLLVWLVSFLLILIYYDNNHRRLLLKQFIL